VVVGAVSALTEELFASVAGSVVELAEGVSIAGALVELAEGMFVSIAGAPVELAEGVFISVAVALVDLAEELLASISGATVGFAGWAELLAGVVPLFTVQRGAREGRRGSQQMDQ
jgi:hypothetical protein